MRLGAAEEEEEEEEEKEEEEEEEDGHLPLGSAGPAEDKAAGDELRDDRGAEARSSSEQSGLSGGFSSFSILAHYFATSSASFHTHATSPPPPPAAPPAPPRLRLIRIKNGQIWIHAETGPCAAETRTGSFRETVNGRVLDRSRARMRSRAARFLQHPQSPRTGMLVVNNNIRKRNRQLHDCSLMEHINAGCKGSGCKI